MSKHLRSLAQIPTIPNLTSTPLDLLQILFYTRWEYSHDFRITWLSPKRILRPTSKFIYSSKTDSRLSCVGTDSSRNAFCSHAPCFPTCLWLNSRTFK